MPYLVNCLDCSFIRARETTFDMGNGDLVRDQHEFLTSDGGGNRHECVVQTQFPVESEFHSSNFEGPISRDPYYGVMISLPRSGVVVARDEYSLGSVQLHWRYHEGLDSNRYTVLHRGCDLPTDDDIPRSKRFDRDEVTVVRQRGEHGAIYICEADGVPAYMLGNDGHEILHTGETPELTP